MAEEFTRRSSSLDDRSSALLDSSDDDDDDDDDDSDEDVSIYLSILLFESLGVVWVLSYPASRPNHTSYRKFYFNEFVENVLHDNMGTTTFVLQDCGGC